MPYVLTDIINLIGYLLRAAGFLVIGLALSVVMNGPQEDKNFGVFRM